MYIQIIYECKALQKIPEMIKQKALQLAWDMGSQKIPHAYISYGV